MTAGGGSSMFPCRGVERCTALGVRRTERPAPIPSPATPCLSMSRARYVLLRVIHGRLARCSRWPLFTPTEQRSQQTRIAATHVSRNHELPGGANSRDCATPRCAPLLSTREMAADDRVSKRRKPNSKNAWALGNPRSVRSRAEGLHLPVADIDVIFLIGHLLVRAELKRNTAFVCELSVCCRICVRACLAMADD
jgi:hypothetical protein